MPPSDHPSIPQADLVPTPPPTPAPVTVVPSGHGGLGATVAPSAHSVVAHSHAIQPPSGSSSATLLQSFTDPTIPAAGAHLLSAAGDPMQSLARDVADAATAALGALGRLWADPPSPRLGTAAADGSVVPSAPVVLLQGSLAWYTAAIAVVSVLLAAGRLAWQRRGEPLVDLVRGLGTLVLVSAAGLTAVTLAVTASDAFAGWILSQVTSDVGGSLTGLVPPPGGDVPVVLTVLLEGVVLIAAVAQIGLILARGVVLVLLAGMLPLTASATSTATGRRVFARTAAWLAAFVLYLPLAASVYAVAVLVAPDPKASPLLATTTGAVAMVLALAALPALLRLLRPATIAVLASRGPAAGVAGLPTGARAVEPAVSTAAPAMRLPGGATRPAQTAAVRTPDRAAGARPLSRGGRPRALLPGRPTAPPEPVLESAAPPPARRAADPEEPLA